MDFKKSCQIMWQIASLLSMVLNAMICCETVQLTKVYKSGWLKQGEKIALSRCSLTFPPDKIITLVGTSGSGKSTLGKLIAQKEIPTSGQIRYTSSLVNTCWVDHLLTLKYDDNQDVLQCLKKASNAKDWHHGFFEDVLLLGGISQNERIRSLRESQRKIFEIILTMAMSVNVKKENDMTNLNSAVPSLSLLSSSVDTSKMPFVIILDEYLDKDIPNIRQRIIDFLNRLTSLSTITQADQQDCKISQRLAQRIQVQTFVITHSKGVLEDTGKHVVALRNGQVYSTGSLKNIYLPNEIIWV